MGEKTWAGAAGELWRSALRHKIVSGGGALLGIGSLTAGGLASSASRQAAGRAAASGYGVSALPQTFFLDARHRVVDRVFGAVTLAALSKGIALATAKG